MLGREDDVTYSLWRFNSGSMQWTREKSGRHPEELKLAARDVFGRFVTTEAKVGPFIILKETTTYSPVECFEFSVHETSVTPPTD